MIELPSPAKVNLMLSVNGRRDDGFHTLVSLVVPLAFGDDLRVRLAAGAAGAAGVAAEDVLRCSDPEVPTGPENLILKAAAAFREALGRAVYFQFDLEKRIPMGAGLGGGSSNAAVALRAMNALLGEPLEKSVLFELSAGIGSDCPFFIDPPPALMLGRGEVIEAVEPGVAERLRGQRLLLFRPDFGVETVWAYGRLVAGAPESYEAASLARARLERFGEGAPWRDLLFNSFEAPIGHKYLSIATLLGLLRQKGVPCLMSGSGSCCFALCESETESVKIAEIVRAAWGEAVFLVETSIS